MTQNNKGKYLIINADDFGLNESTNRAVTELFEKGLISSSTLMPCAPCAVQAASVCAERRLPVGVHWTINSDSATEPWPSLTGAKSLSENGGFYHSQSALALHARSRDVTAELEAQYEFMARSGCAPDHADNHCATLYGINGRMFFINAFRLCAKYSLAYRFPRTRGFLDRQLGGRAPEPVIWFQKFIVSVADRYKVALIDDLITNPLPANKTGGYEGLRDYYIDAVRSSKGPITEVFMHPSYPIGESDPDSEWIKREHELRLLLSGDLHCAARSAGFELVSWGEAPFGVGEK